MNVTCFSQRDPRWTGDTLGTGTPTIGQAGCLITAMASILADFGAPTDPGRLNRWLVSHGGYSQGNRFIFASVAGLGADLQSYVECRLEPAPVDTLVAALEAGCGVVVEVDYEPGGVLNRHWVRLVALASGSGWIMDPWQLPGSEMAALAEYLKDGWSSERGIFAAATYAANGDRAFEVWTPAGARQGRVAIRVR